MKEMHNGSPMPSLLKPAGLALLLGLVFSQPLWAHALLADCKINKGKVEVEAWYDGGTPAEMALVKVLNAAKKTIAEGKTDAKGFWAFPVPQPGDYQVIVDAGAGHRRTKKITIRAKDRPAAIDTKDSAASTSKNGDPLPTNEATDSDLITDEETIGQYRLLKVVLGVAAILALAIGYLAIRQALRPPISQD